MATMKEIDDALRSLPFGRESEIPNEQEMFLKTMAEELFDWIDCEWVVSIVQRLMDGGYSTLHEVIQDFYPRLPPLEIVDDDELDEDDDE